MLTPNPIPESKFIVLRGLQEGNKFCCCYQPDHDFTKLTDGTVAYTVLGYCATVEEAQVYLFGRVYSTFGGRLGLETRPS